MDLNQFFGSNPERPEHPDFWRLSDIILQLDGRMDAATTDEERQNVWHNAVDHSVNEEALTYMAMQRAMRILGISTKPELMVRAREVTMLTTVYMEGFLVGTRFLEKGGKQ